MLRQILTLFVFVAICAAFPFSAHATACPGGVSCSVDSTAAGPNLTIGSGGTLGMTVNKTTGQTTMSVPLQLGQESSTTDCTSTLNVGAVRYNNSTHAFEGCDGTSWKLMASSPGASGFRTSDLYNAGGGPCGHWQYCTINYTVQTQYKPQAINCTPETWSDQGCGYQHDTICNSILSYVSGPSASGMYTSYVTINIYAGSDNAFCDPIYLDISLLPGIAPADVVGYGGASVSPPP